MRHARIHAVLIGSEPVLVPLLCILCLLGAKGLQDSPSQAASKNFESQKTLFAVSCKYVRRQSIQDTQVSDNHQAVRSHQLVQARELIDD